MELFAQIKLPKALKKASGSSMQFKIGDINEFAQEFQTNTGMLEVMPNVKPHNTEKMDEGRARLM